MEFLVTMTTHVPDGTPEAEVVAIRAREAVRAAELAAEGHLLRLWRPPLAPGEWRTLGLFAAHDAEQLEEVLASMPLRVWRTDQAMPLAAHPNDPPSRPRAEERAEEFLVNLAVNVPVGTPDEMVEETKRREQERAEELAARRHLLRLWKPPAEPGEWRVLGLWAADDGVAMRAILESLPLYPWITAETTPLSPHPSDPARAGA